MFTFNNKVASFLDEISSELHIMARKKADSKNVDFPHIESMAILLHNLATMDEPFSGVDDYCKRIIEGASHYAQLLINKSNEVGNG